MVQRAKVPAITADQARYILSKLIDERRVSAVDVRRHLASMGQEMSFLEKRLEELRAIAGALHPVRRVKAALKRVGKRRRKASPEVAASQKLQGQYLGYMRQIPEGDRKRFADIAKSKGREAAVAALKKRLGK
jgi:O6-methylguanine-DNA--protein-cysteine methyltransferase